MQHTLITSLCCNYSYYSVLTVDSVQFSSACQLLSEFAQFEQHIRHYTFTDWTASVTALDRSVKATYIVTIPECQCQVKSGTVLDTPSQLGTLLGESGEPGTLSRAVQLWTDKGGFADDGLTNLFHLLILTV